MYNKQFRLANADSSSRDISRQRFGCLDLRRGWGMAFALLVGVFLVEFVKCKCANLGPVIRNQVAKLYFCVGDLF